jgi:ABC-type sugar transport system ATPase subunit
MSAAEARDTSPALLEVRGVSKRFGGVQALSDVSLTVRAGECVALMGGNGAGKSTLVSLISGLGAPDEGEILFEGVLASFHGPDDARAVGIETVFQNLALCDNLDAPGNLFLGREPRRRFGPISVMNKRKMAQDTRATLAELGVNMPNLRSATATLSGGQRQALAFARAVRSRSKLLILDEPTAALGVAERARVAQTVNTLRADLGLSVLLISHSLEEIRNLADRVVVMRHGRTVGSLDVRAAGDNAIVHLLTGAQS